MSFVNSMRQVRKLNDAHDPFYLSEYCYSMIFIRKRNLRIKKLVLGLTPTLGIRLEVVCKVVCSTIYYGRRVNDR